MEAKKDEFLTAAYLNCFLCDQRCLQPRLCPRCTKSFCSSCLLPSTASLRPDCPACAARIKPDDFLSPHIVMAIADQIVENVRRQIKKNEDRQICKQHNLSMNYYCIDCNQALCSDCGMIGSKHKNHKFMNYRDIYERVKTKVMEQFPRFDRKIKSLVAKKDTMKVSMDLLHSEYRRFKKFFEQSFISYTEKVQKQGKVLQERLLAKEESNARRHNQLEVLRDSIFDEMQTKTQISLIKQANSLAQSIEALACQQTLPVFGQPMPELEELTDLVPQFTFWKYTLTNFSTRSGIVYSEGHNLNGVQWRLKIYPRGNGLARDKYISVFVQMTKGLVNQNRYEYRIQLLNPLRPQLSVKREYCSSFQIGQCWGYNQFEPLDQLAAKEYIQDDKLYFQVGIRNRTYRSLVEEKQLYILHLKDQIRQKQLNKHEAGEVARDGMSEGASQRPDHFSPLDKIKYMLQSKRSCDW